MAYANWATLASTDEELDRFEEAYLGHFDSVTEYAWHLLDDLGVENEIERLLPEHLLSYVKVDAEGFSRGLEPGGDITAIGSEEGGVYVFSAR